MSSYNDCSHFNQELPSVSRTGITREDGSRFCNAHVEILGLKEALKNLRAHPSFSQSKEKRSLRGEALVFWNERGDEHYTSEFPTVTRVLTQLGEDAEGDTDQAESARLVTEVKALWQAVVDSTTPTEKLRCN